MSLCSFVSNLYLHSFSQPHYHPMFKANYSCFSYIIILSHKLDCLVTCEVGSLWFQEFYCYYWANWMVIVWSTSLQAAETVAEKAAMAEPRRRRLGWRSRLLSLRPQVPLPLPSQSPPTPHPLQTAGTAKLTMHCSHRKTILNWKMKKA